MMGDIIVLVMSILLIITVMIGVLEVIITVYYQLAMERVGEQIILMTYDNIPFDLSNFLEEKFRHYGLKLSSSKLEKVIFRDHYVECKISFSCTPEYKGVIFKGLPSHFNFQRKIIRKGI